MDNTDDVSYLGRALDALLSADSGCARPVSRSMDRALPHFWQVVCSAGWTESSSGISPAVLHTGHMNFIVISFGDPDFSKERLLSSVVRPSAAGFGCQVSGFRKHKQLIQRATVIIQQSKARILTPETHLMGPDTRNLQPTYSWFFKLNIGPYLKYNNHFSGCLHSTCADACSCRANSGLFFLYQINGRQTDNRYQPFHNDVGKKYGPDNRIR